MDFILGYRDPLFGLIVFVGLIFIVSFFSYWWAVLKFKKQNSSIERFFKRFEAGVPKAHRPKDPKEAMMLMAKAYEKSGDYEKAIALYLDLAKIADEKERVEILKRLGDLYFKAGFMARSIEIYEEILRYFPRNVEVLRRLMRVYERMGRLDDAMEVVSILEELGQKDKESLYILAKFFASQERMERLIELYRLHPFLIRVVAQKLFEKNPDAAWRTIRKEDLFLISDILWTLPKERISTHTPFLKELYSAKGYLKEADESGIWELDVILHYPKAGLAFEYLCPSCKNIFPFAFSRCPRCQSVEPLVPQYLLTPRRVDEESFSL